MSQFKYTNFHLILFTFCLSIFAHGYAQSSKTVFKKPIHKASYYLSLTGKFEELGFDTDMPIMQLDMHPELPSHILISIDLIQSKKGDSYKVLQDKKLLWTHKVKYKFGGIESPRYEPKLLSTSNFCTDIEVRHYRKNKLLSKQTILMACAE